MKYRVVHTTEYRYSAPVTQCHNVGRLLPRSFARQTCGRADVTIVPPPQDYREHGDFYGNRACYFAIHRPHTTLTVTATSEVQVDPEVAQLNFSQDGPWEEVCRHLKTSKDPIAFDARQYILDSPMVTATRELAQYGKPSFSKGRPVIEAVHDLMQRIHRDFVYDPEFTTLATPLAQVLKHRRGVCQDFAHLAIGCLRAQGLAARYTSGYIETLPPPGKEKLVGADASHAWFSVYVPGTGWLDYDPTNNQMPMERHITVAWGRDYSDVTPLKGVIFGGGKHKLKVSVDVRNLGP
jgi:transglutaminase-like putative cysteine protease